MLGRRFHRALLGAIVAVGFASGGVAACASGDELRPPPRPRASAGAGGGGGNLFGTGEGAGPPALDAGGLCGNEIHTIVSNAPNLYFVLDASGSMGAMVGGGYTRYALVDESARIMQETLGTLINVGAAVFPKKATPEDSCPVGGEVFPVQPGDPAGSDGDTIRGFMAATNVEPSGGTPTAATLVALKRSLMALKGKTVVLLATDGGPNCNAAASCTASRCLANIEGQCPVANCCAASIEHGPEGCLDEDPTVAAIADLATSNIPVYVIGIPGSELYSGVLDAMAKAGGAANPGSPSYFRVDDLTRLSSVFQTIASGVVSCEFLLDDPPEDELHTNVYLDQTVVPADKNNGWIWKSPSVVELTGSVCQKLKNGGVRHVQIVSGCPTEQPK